MLSYLIVCGIIWLLAWCAARIVLFPHGVISINPVGALLITVKATTIIAFPWWAVLALAWRW